MRAITARATMAGENNKYIAILLLQNVECKLVLFVVSCCEGTGERQPPQQALVAIA
jgi:hypothetical protein